MAEEDFDRQSPWSRSRGLVARDGRHDGNAVPCRCVVLFESNHGSTLYLQRACVSAARFVHVDPLLIDPVYVQVVPEGFGRKLPGDNVVSPHCREPNIQRRLACLEASIWSAQAYAIILEAGLETYSTY